MITPRQLLALTPKSSDESLPGQQICLQVP